MRRGRKKKRTCFSLDFSIHWAEVDSVHRQAATDIDGCAGHVAGPMRAEEGNDVGYFFRPANPVPAVRVC